VNSAKFIVSSESVGVPTAEPRIARSPLMSCNGVTAIGSGDIPTTMNFPVGAMPSINSDMAFELGAVARIACAPPNFWSSSTTYAASATETCDPQTVAKAVKGYTCVVKTKSGSVAWRVEAVIATENRTFRVVRDLKSDLYVSDDMGKHSHESA